MQRPPAKKILRKKKGRLKPGAKKKGPGKPGIVQHQAPPPKPKPVMDFLEKDPWGYRFAVPMWKLDPGSESLKRDPKDQERERINRVLRDQFELDPPREGFDSEIIPWGLFREETKLGRRRQFAEAVRKECLEARNGLLGIAQIHYLASKFALMCTLRAKCDVAAFPLELAIEETTLKERYEAKYVLQIDRVFYPVSKVPQVDRFALPLLVVDALRIFEAGGESHVRSGNKTTLARISSVADRDTPLHWKIERGPKLPDFELKENRDRSATLFMHDKPCGSIVPNTELKSHAVDFTLRFDEPGEAPALLGVLIAYVDAVVQRRQGVLARAREHMKEEAVPDAAPERS